jgi:anti-sigma-K factor RskA
VSNSQHPSPEDLTLCALGSLAPEEARVIRAHAAQCEECRGELSRLNLDLAYLALDVPVAAPSEGARQRFMARVENEASLPGFRQAAAQAGRKLVAMQSSKPRTTGAETPARAGHAGQPRRGGWGMPWAVALVCGALAIYAGIDNFLLRDRLNNLSRRSQGLEAAAHRATDALTVLTTPSAQHVTLTAGAAPPQPTGRASYMRARGQLVFTANNLAALPPGKIYELWLIPAKGSPIPAGTFAPDAQGSAAVVFPQIPAGVEAKAFGVTVEPEGGSNAPTSAILLQGS